MMVATATTHGHARWSHWQAISTLSRPLARQPSPQYSSSPFTSHKHVMCAHFLGVWFVIEASVLFNFNSTDFNHRTSWLQSRDSVIGIHKSITSALAVANHECILLAIAELSGICWN
jgi:hypothetical protein